MGEGDKTCQGSQKAGPLPTAPPVTGPLPTGNITNVRGRYQRPLLVTAPPARVQRQGANKRGSYHEEDVAVCEVNVVTHQAPHYVKARHGVLCGNPSLGPVPDQMPRGVFQEEEVKRGEVAWLETLHVREQRPEGPRLVVLCV